MNLQIFKNKEFGEIRVVEIEGEPWLVGRDVAENLGYAKPHNALSTHVDVDDTLKQGIMDNLGRNQETTLINESGLYTLVLGSKLANAKKFRKWVTSEVIPSIRKHGVYMTPEIIEEVLLNPDTIIQLATNLKEEQQRRVKAEKLVEEQKPKVLFAEAVENSEDVILVKEMALILSQHGFKVGQNQLFEFLRKYEYLCKKTGNMFNLPTKKYEHFFKVTKRTIQHTNGTTVKNTPKITGKGQIYFIKKFAEYGAEGLTIKELLDK